MATDKDGGQNALADTLIDIVSIQEVSTTSPCYCTFPRIDTHSDRGTLSFTWVLEVKRMFSLQKPGRVQRAKS